MLENPLVLTCPRCALPLTEVKTEGGIFWACHNCGGRAITIELIRKRFTPESVNPLWLHALRGQGPWSSPCPSCRKPMTEVAVSDTSPVKVDVCTHCHFIWFDAREVEALVPRPLPSEPAEPVMSQEAREKLAIAKVQVLAEQAQVPDFNPILADQWWRLLAFFCNLP